MLKRLAFTNLCNGGIVVKEFKSFLMRGNVLDLAVGIIIGAAFGKIVSSFVGDVLTPILSLFMGKIDFANLFFALNGQHYATLEEAKKAGAATVNYGLFFNSVIDFVIMGFAIFMIVKLAARLYSQPAPAAPNTKECPFCVTAVNVKASRCPACTSQLS
jgi:large conductance mechanosensitive channel